MTSRSDADLRASTAFLRERLSAGTSLESLLPVAFAAVREAAHRTIGQRPVDEQIMGGVALHLGTLAEMKTGEGKTLTITMPAYLNALTGRSVHVMTANEYLAARDAEWMRPVYQSLGLECALIAPGGAHAEESAGHKTAYAADVTYGNPHTMAYDYLRDNMAWALGEVVQRGHHLAIVDEADLILIDEAQIQLQIGTAVTPSGPSYASVSIVAGRLERDRHYSVDHGRKIVSLTEEGVARAEDLLGTANLYESTGADLLQRLENCLKAKELFLQEVLTVALRADVQGAYDRRESALGLEITRELERRVILSVIDRDWCVHLAAMGDLLSEATLHSLAGADRLAHYQREGTRVFEALLDSLKEETVGYLFGLDVEVEAADPETAG